MKNNQTDGRKSNGGARMGAGRPKKEDKDKKNTYSVLLTEENKAKLVAKYGSLTKAIGTLILQLA